MRLFWVIFKTLWSLHNELIWLGLPNYTDHISLPFSSNPDCKWVFVLFLVVPYARSCQSFVSLSAMWSLTAHIMQSNTFILPFLQISISGTATRIVRKRFLKIAIRVFGGSTDTVLHSNAAHPNNKKMFLIFCWPLKSKSHFSDVLWNWFWPFLEPKLSDNFMVIKSIKLTHLNGTHHHFVILTYKKVKQLLGPRLFITSFNSEEGRTPVWLSIKSQVMRWRESAWRHF